MNYFKTVSTNRKPIIALSIQYSFLFIISFFLITVNVMLWILFEAMALIMFLAVLLNFKRAHRVIEFHDDTLTLQSYPGVRTHRFENLTRSSLILKQTKRQKKLDLGDARIKDHPQIIMNDIKNYSDFVKYIETNLK